MNGLEAAIDRFRVHLLTACGLSAVERFDRHLESISLAAFAEAAIFDLLVSHGLSPVATDDPSTGGVDIQCSLAGVGFAVEVTSLGSDTIDSRCLNAQPTGGFMLNTSEFLALVRQRVSSKGTNAQARRSVGPRVLAIITDHPFAGAFLRVAAAELLTGQVGRAWPVGRRGSEGASYPFTELKNAAHLRWDPNHAVGTFRPRDALILLAMVDNEKIELLGVENPNPGYKLPSGALSFVPTTCMVAGVGEASLHLAWSLESHEPYCHRFALAK